MSPLSSRRVSAFVDPATLITLGVITLTLVGTLVATKLTQDSADTRSQARGTDPCKICQAQQCKTIDSPPACNHGFDECSSNQDCGAPAPPPSGGCDDHGYDCVHNSYVCSHTYPQYDDCGLGKKCGDDCHPPPTNTPAPTLTPRPPTSTPAPTPIPTCHNQGGLFCNRSSYVCSDGAELPEYSTTTNLCCDASAGCSAIPTIRPTLTPRPPTSTPAPTLTPRPTGTPAPTPIPTCRNQGGLFCNRSSYVCSDGAELPEYSTTTNLCCDASAGCSAIPTVRPTNPPFTPTSPPVPPGSPTSPPSASPTPASGCGGIDQACCVDLLEYTFTCQVGLVMENANSLTACRCRSPQTNPDYCTPGTKQCGFDSTSHQPVLKTCLTTGAWHLTPCAYGCQSSSSTCAPAPTPIPTAIPTPPATLKTNQAVCTTSSECLSYNCQPVPGGVKICLPPGTTYQSLVTTTVGLDEACGTTSFSAAICASPLICTGGKCQPAPTPPPTNACLPTTSYCLGRETECCSGTTCDPLTYQCTTSSSVDYTLDISSIGPYDCYFEATRSTPQCQTYFATKGVDTTLAALDEASLTELKHCADNPNSTRCQKWQDEQVDQGFLTIGVLTVGGLAIAGAPASIPVAINIVSSTRATYTTYRTCEDIINSPNATSQELSQCYLEIAKTGVSVASSGLSTASTINTALKANVAFNAISAGKSAVSLGLDAYSTYSDCQDATDLNCVLSAGGNLLDAASLGLNVYDTTLLNTAFKDLNQLTSQVDNSKQILDLVKNQHGTVYTALDLGINIADTGLSTYNTIDKCSDELGVSCLKTAVSDVKKITSTGKDLYTIANEANLVNLIEAMQTMSTIAVPPGTTMNIIQ